jgi:hypothetical protein
MESQWTFTFFFALDIFLIQKRILHLVQNIVRYISRVLMTQIRNQKSMLHLHATLLLSIQTSIFFSLKYFSEKSINYSAHVLLMVPLIILPHS